MTKIEPTNHPHPNPNPLTQNWNPLPPNHNPRPPKPLPKVQTGATPVDLAKHRSKPTPKNPLPQTSTNPNHLNSHQNNTQNPPHQHLKPPKHLATTTHQTQDPQPTTHSNPSLKHRFNKPMPITAKPRPMTHGKQNLDVFVTHPWTTVPKSNIKPTTHPCRSKRDGPR